jgi:hypothetical protein
MSWECVIVQELDLPKGKYATFTISIDNRKEALAYYAEVSVWLSSNNVINLIEVFQTEVNDVELFVFIVRVPELYKLAFEDRFCSTEEG